MQVFDLRYGHFNLDLMFPYESTTLRALFLLYLYKGKYFIIPNFLNNDIVDMVKFYDSNLIGSPKYLKLKKGYLHNDYTCPWVVKDVLFDFGFFKKSILIGIDFDIVTSNQSSSEIFQGNLELMTLYFSSQSSRFLTFQISYNYQLEIDNIESSNLKLNVRLKNSLDHSIHSSNLTLRFSENEFNFMNTFEKNIKMSKLIPKIFLSFRITFNLEENNVSYQIITGYKQNNISSLKIVYLPNLRSHIAENNEFLVDFILGNVNYQSSNIDNYFERESNRNIFMRFYELKILEGAFLNSDVIENDLLGCLFSGLPNDIHSVILNHESNQILNRIKSLELDSIKNISDLNFENIQKNLKNPIFVNTSIEIENCESFIENFCIKCLSGFVINFETNQCEKCEYFFLSYGELCIDSSLDYNFDNLNQDNIKEYNYNEKLSNIENNNFFNWNYCPNIFFKGEFNSSTNEKDIDIILDSKNVVEIEKDTVYSANIKFYLNSELISDFISSLEGIPIRISQFLKTLSISTNELHIDYLNSNEIWFNFSIVFNQLLTTNYVLYLQDYDFFRGNLSDIENFENKERKDKFISNISEKIKIISLESMTDQNKNKLKSITSLCKVKSIENGLNEIYEIIGIFSLNCRKNDLTISHKIFDSSFFLIKRCSSNCIDCSINYRVCQKCSEKYFLQNGQCLPCSEKCLTCQNQSNTCIKFNPGKILI